MATNAIFGFPRYTPDVTWSGGSWETDYPRTNLGTLPLAYVARTTDATTASTQVVGTFSRDRPLSLIGICRHNLSLDATYRVRVYADAARTTLLYDTGTVDVWPAVYPAETLEWEDDRWWDGKYSEEEIAGYTWTRPIWLGQVYLVRAFLLEITDTANDDGFVQIGLLEVSEGRPSSVNMAYDYQEDWVDRSVVVEGLGGIRYVERRDEPRTVRGEIRYLNRDEALAKFFEMRRRMRADLPVLYFPFPDETVHWLRTAMLATLDRPGPIAYSAKSRNTVPIALREML
jgi:hypothetical protein